MILVPWPCMTLMQFQSVKMMNKQSLTSLMRWLIMSNSFSSKPSKLKRIKSHLLSHFLKNNKFTISPNLNFICLYPSLEFNSQEASNFLNKNQWPNGKDLLNKKISKKERKLEWSTIHKPKLWLPDGELNLKKMLSNLLLWKRNNSIETPSPIKRKREILTRQNKNLKKLKTSKEDKITSNPKEKNEHKKWTKI